MVSAYPVSSDKNTGTQITKIRDVYEEELVPDRIWRNVMGGEKRGHRLINEEEPVQTVLAGWLGLGVRRRVEHMFQPLEFGGFCLPISLGFFAPAFPLAAASS